MHWGYKLAAEAFGPAELVRQAARAEEAGFDFVEMSDHFHPWLDVQGHSPHAWSVLGAIAARTERIGLATGVTCPTVRYHPAVIAQAAATLGLLSDGRFTLGLGTGERLNEHVVGTEFPDEASTRTALLDEAIDIIRLLWQGGYHSYDGRHLKLSDARVFDLPDPLPPLAIAAGGTAAAEVAGNRGDALFATEADPDLVEAFRAAGGTGPTIAEVPVAWAEDAGQAAEAAWQTSRWALLGWKVMSELPNPVNFEAASAYVQVADLQSTFACGNDPDRYLEVCQPFADAGFDHLVLMNTGPDPDGFLTFFDSTLTPALRAA